MINESWRQGIQVEVAHTIGAYHHRCFLCVERIDNSLKCLGRRVEVVAIQLYSEASTEVTLYGLVPTATNTEVSTLRDDDVEFVVILRRQAGQYL